MESLGIWWKHGAHPRVFSQEHAHLHVVPYVLHGSHNQSFMSPNPTVGL